MVIREALACGVPILASRLGPLIELVDEKVGMTFDYKNSEALIDCLKLMLKAPEYNLEEKCINARSRFLERYTASKNFSRLIEIYDEAINISNQAKQK